MWKKIGRRVGYIFLAWPVLEKILSWWGLTDFVYSKITDGTVKRVADFLLLDPPAQLTNALLLTAILLLGYGFGVHQQIWRLIRSVIADSNCADSIQSSNEAISESRGTPNRVGDSDQDSNSAPDMEMSAAAFCVAGINAANNLKDEELEKLLNALATIRQLAHYGRITIWGKEMTSQNSALRTLSPIPKDYWRTKELNPALLVENGTELFPNHTIIEPGATGTAVNFPDYTETHVNTSELTEAMQSMAKTSQNKREGQTLYIAGNKLPKQGQMTFPHTLDKIPSRVELTLICTDSDLGYSPGDPIHGDFGAKSTMTDNNVTIYIRNISINIPHKYEPGAWGLIDINKWKLKVTVYE